MQGFVQQNSHAMIIRRRCLVNKIIINQCMHIVIHMHAGIYYSCYLHMHAIHAALLNLQYGYQYQLKYIACTVLYDCVK